MVAKRVSTLAELAAILLIDLPGSFVYILNINGCRFRKKSKKRLSTKVLSFRF
jgi:hypothetical protein